MKDRGLKKQTLKGKEKGGGQGGINSLGKIKKSYCIQETRTQC